ncbi:SNF2 family N-terminal domain-containing protein, partial [Annulohypoxylon nitens]
MSENDESIYTRTPTSAIKRSWESTTYGDESSGVAYIDSTKRTCIAESVDFQQLNTLEAANLNHPNFLTPVHTSIFEHAPSIEPAIFSSLMPPGSHLPISTNNVGHLSYPPSDTSYQQQSLIDQGLSTQIHGSGQQWMPQNGEEWQSFGFMENTYANWPASNLSSFQEPTIPINETYREVLGCIQQEQVVASIGVVNATTENQGIDADNSMAEYSSSNHDSSDERHFESENDIQSLVSPFESSSTPQDMVVDGLVTSDENVQEPSSYDSCFGVITFEDLKVSQDFVKRKDTTYASLEVNGGIVIIREAQSNKYGGLLSSNASRVVSDLIKTSDVELSAMMKTPNKIEILIYGRLEESETIGDMLLERDCFLQQPDSHDISRPYHNPQCLSDPDEESSWEVQESSPAKSSILCEGKKSRVVELLDSATGPTSFKRVQISDILISELKEHQVKALSMMIEKESGNITDAEFPSVWSESFDTRFSNNRFYNHVTKRYAPQNPRLCLGGLLADEMGLGKTLTTLAHIAASLVDENPTLIVCPMTIITCWQDQIERHFKKGSLIYRIYHGSTRDNNIASLKRANIVITTYETLRAELPDDTGVNQRLAKSTKVGLLHDIPWHRVVLDEAHIIRNRATKIFKAVYKLKARHRWCLSGTPIQNRLEDLGALVEFLRVAPFDNPRAFKSTFLTPINQKHKSGWERLRLLVKSITLRRTKNALTSELNLLPRYDKIHIIDLDDKERDLYRLVTRQFALAIDSGNTTMKTFQFILRLRQICNHGYDLLPPSLRARLREASTFNIVLPQYLACEICDSAIDEEDESCVCTRFHQVCRACLTNDNTSVDDTGSICPLCDDGTLGESKKIHVKQGTISESSPADYRPSSKVKALLRNLENDHQVACERNQPPEKSVIFSAWTGMLDLIGKALSIKAFKYQRLDGSMNLKQRSQALDDFRKDQECTILLASLGSAAVGYAVRPHINL